jgi:NADPH-dependent 2,4-dienoyl-CoA reductase/sulfur reductase-like enzyme
MTPRGKLTTEPAAARAPDCKAQHVVVIGAGFGGLAAVRDLRRAPVRVTWIDRKNYHLFQPLLYQVATAALSPADIAAPTRAVARSWRNVEPVLDEVIGIDVEARAVNTTRQTPTTTSCWARARRPATSATKSGRGWPTVKDAGRGGRDSP